MVAALVGAAIFTVGCTSNKPFRTNYSPCTSASALSGGADSQPVIETNQDFQVGFVEFDDQGRFYNPKQLITVRDMVAAEGGVGTSNNQAGIVLVVFAHGWKNNAAVDNTNVVMFRKTLQQLSQIEKTQTKHRPRKVVGVYAGWRGLSATLEPFVELSFWDRKNTAHKVGGYGGMTELLMDMEVVQQKSNESLVAGAPRTELIIVGHSFGGAAVFSALGQIVAERTVQTIKQEEGERLKPLGDQVILLNPAFEAARFFDLQQLARSIHSYPPDQRPVLSIFTSKGDWATHYVFPLGRFFSTLFESYQNDDEKKADREAVGWFQPYVTHSLLYHGPTNGTARTFTGTTQTTDLATVTQLSGQTKSSLRRPPSRRVPLCMNHQVVMANGIVLSKRNIKGWLKVTQEL